MLLVSIIFAYFSSSVFADPILTIKQGQLNGTVLKSRNGKSFFAFYGIPYADPPVGKLRFAPPHKEPSWQGIRDASTKAPICLQPKSFVRADTEFIGQEDCLYLSVFTPDVNSSKLLPVMVYIHGGAYHTGSGDSKGPNFLMDKEIVIVTMNYRHGIFGFLSAGDKSIAGNYGLKDQVAALKWVKSNIANFGGDPNTVTILGQSSGATCVHLHTMSPLSKGLFHRAVMQSGSALSFWSHYDTRNAKHCFKDTLKRINCTQNETSGILRYLRELPAETLIRAEHSFRMEKRIVMKYRPVVEHRRVKNAFMSVSPHTLNYQNTNIPWIIGFNSAEGMLDAIWFLLNKTASNKGLDTELDKIMPYMLHYKYSYARKENITNYTKVLKQYYFNNGTLHETDHQQLCNLIGDIVFGMPALQAAYTYPGPKYFYYFDTANNSSSTNVAKFFGATKIFDMHGAVHSDEMKLLFQDDRYRSTEAQLRLSSELITYWTNFIITGNPNSADLPIWNISKSDNGDYLHITNDEFKMENNLLHERYNLWKTINNL